MANWITHTILTDRLLARGLELHGKGFCIGNIAPDCNVENADWSSFIPTREVTHYMTGSGKDSSDLKGFWTTFIDNRTFENAEERSYLLGYFTHLVTDVCYQKFVRDPVRVSACYDRLSQDKKATVVLSGLPQDVETLKKVFGKKRVFGDIAVLENNYVATHPDCSYNQILRKTTIFPDYLGILPDGAIRRKIAIMTHEVTGFLESSHLIFFSEKEYMCFLQQTEDRLYALLKEMYDCKKSTAYTQCH